MTQNTNQLNNIEIGCIYWNSNIFLMGVFTSIHTLYHRSVIVASDNCKVIMYIVSVIHYMMILYTYTIALKYMSYMAFSIFTEWKYDGVFNVITPTLNKNRYN